MIIITTDFIQSMCIWVRNIALLFYVMEMTRNNPIAVSLLTFFEYLPMFVFAYIGGTCADRYNPKKTMILGDSLSALSVLIILILVLNGYWKAVFFATFISAIVSQFSLPASSVMFKKYVEEDQITLALSISQTLQSLFLLIGPIIGGFIYYKLGIKGTLILIIILFLASAAVELLLPLFQNVGNKSESIMKEMREGIKYLFSNRNLLTLSFIYFFASLSEGMVQPLFVFVLMERLSLPKESIQWFLSIAGAGLLIGTIFAGIFLKRMDYKIIIFGTITFFSISIVAEVLSVWVALTASMQFVTGLIAAFLQVVIRTLELTLVEEKYVGRMNGLFTPISLSGFVVGPLISGFMVVHFTIIPTYIISASIMFIAAIVSLRLDFKTNEKALIK